MLAWRRRHVALRLGRFVLLEADDDLLVFERRHRGGTVLAAFNLGARARNVGTQVPGVGEAIVLNGARCDGSSILLPPGAAFVRSATP